MFTTDGLILLSEEIEVKEFQERSLRPNLIKKNLASYICAYFIDLTDLSV